MIAFLSLTLYSSITRIEYHSINVGKIEPNTFTLLSKYVFGSLLFRRYSKPSDVYFLLSLACYQYCSCVGNFSRWLYVPCLYLRLLFLQLFGSANSRQCTMRQVPGFHFGLSQPLSWPPGCIGLRFHWPLDPFSIMSHSLYGEGTECCSNFFIGI